MLRYSVTHTSYWIVAALLLTACSSEKTPSSMTADSTAEHAVQTKVTGAATAAHKQPTSASLAASNTAVKAYIDPATGELRDPTPAELAAETAANKRNASAAQEDKQLREIIRPDGSVEVLIDPASAHPLQGCLQKDGSVVMDHHCKSDLSEAK